MSVRGRIHTCSDFAIKVPEVDAIRQLLVTLTFDVFVHLRTDRVDKAGGSDHRMRERKEFIHSLIKRLANGPKSNRYLAKQAFSM